MNNNSYSIPEAAAAVGVHYQSMRSWVIDGLVKSFAVGRRKRVPASEVERLLRGEPQQVAEPVPHTSAMEELASRHGVGGAK